MIPLHIKRLLFHYKTEQTFSFCCTQFTRIIHIEEVIVMKGYFRKRGSKWSFSIDVGRDPETG
ncbi:hypothetical protein, partial [Aneurinibacillus migulanus]|uniref:hypothetical protein n=1 Tax=Aneurinibacillus migulanus TaxID=47500 RepID=UPI0011436D72